MNGTYHRGKRRRGLTKSCGLRTDQTIECWVDHYSYFGPLEVPDGTFTAVSAGLFGSCGLRTDQTIECWVDDDNNDIGQDDVPDGTYIAVSVGGIHSCGLRTDQTSRMLGQQRLHGRAMW